MRLFSVFMPVMLLMLVAGSCEKSTPDSNLPAGDSTHVLYAIKPNGDLGWYRHVGYQSGVPVWANNGQFVQVGEDWDYIIRAFRADSNIIYAVRPNGSLGWYRHTGWQTADRSGWENTGQFRQISNSNWAVYDRLFSGGGQIIYAIKANGDLGWFRHTGQPGGTDDWANGGAFTKVGEGFSDFTHVFSPGNGIIYAVKPNGDLVWFKHLGYEDGTNRWANGGVYTRVGEDWDRFYLVFSGGGEIIYGVQPTGELGWYRHTGQDNGTPSWANNGQFVQVGENWNVFMNAF